MTLKELCKKYKLEVVEFDSNSYKVTNNIRINLDKFMNDLGVCSILMGEDFKYKKIGVYHYKIGRLYAFTTERNFKQSGIDYRHELINSGIMVATEQNRILPDDVI